MADIIELLEPHPVRLAGRGFGLVQALNGIGKIQGPLCLGLIAGGGNFVTPKATAGAVVPAFLFLACCGLLAGLCFMLYARETRGQALALRIESQEAVGKPPEGRAAGPTPSPS